MGDRPALRVLRGPPGPPCWEEETLSALHLVPWNMVTKNGKERTKEARIWHLECKLKGVSQNTTKVRSAESYLFIGKSQRETERGHLLVLSPDFCSIRGQARLSRSWYPGKVTRSLSWRAGTQHLEPELEAFQGLLQKKAQDRKWRMN